MPCRHPTPGVYHLIQFLEPVLHEKCLTTARVLSTKALMPKSAILACPPSVIKMLAGLMSLCTWSREQRTPCPQSITCRRLAGHAVCSMLCAEMCKGGLALTVCLWRCRYDSPCSTCAVMADSTSSGMRPSCVPQPLFSLLAAVDVQPASSHCRASTNGVGKFPAAPHLLQDVPQGAPVHILQHDGDLHAVEGADEWLLILLFTHR